MRPQSELADVGCIVELAENLIALAVAKHLQSLAGDQKRLEPYIEEYFVHGELDAVADSSEIGGFEQLAYFGPSEKLVANC